MASSEVSTMAARWKPVLQPASFADVPMNWHQHFPAASTGLKMTSMGNSVPSLRRPYSSTLALVICSRDGWGQAAGSEPRRTAVESTLPPFFPPTPAMGSRQLLRLSATRTIRLSRFVTTMASFAVCSQRNVREAVLQGTRADGILVLRLAETAQKRRQCGSFGGKSVRRRPNYDNIFAMSPAPVGKFSAVIALLIIAIRFRTASGCSRKTL
jgi:hypothetical protein